MTTCSSTGPSIRCTIFRYLRSSADVVAVDRADVAEAQVLEHHAAAEARLDGFLELHEEPLGRIAQQRHAVEQLDDLALEPRVRRVHPQAIEIVGHAADARADRHLVVVEDDQQLFALPAAVVERLEHDARGEGAVADHRDGVAVLFRPEEVVAARAGRARSRRSHPAWPVMNRS